MTDRWREKGNKLKERDPEIYARLVAESKAPYRGLRQFVYLAFGLSGLVGAFIFATQLAAGRGETNTLPNLALQLGLVALMAWFFRLEQKAAARRRG